MTKVMDGRNDCKEGKYDEGRKMSLSSEGGNISFADGIIFFSFLLYTIKLCTLRNDKVHTVKNACISRRLV